MKVKPVLMESGRTTIQQRQDFTPAGPEERHRLSRAAQSGLWQGEMWEGSPEMVLWEEEVEK